MEAAMTSITIDRDRIDAGGLGTLPTFDRIVRRLRVHVRRHRMDRIARAKIEMIRFETADPRILIDIGIDPKTYRRYDWLKEMARAMGNGPL
jgi:hypothetical protein